LALDVRRHYALLFLVWAVASVGAWPAATARGDEVDEYAKAAIERRHIPGLAIAVIKDGKLLFERQYARPTWRPTPR
jgi:CubicO group peptidase (beta-lactamase class C family)